MRGILTLTTVTENDRDRKKGTVIIALTHDIFEIDASDYSTSKSKSNALCIIQL